MVPVPGLNEFVMLIFVALCVFGAGKLPAIATAMGKALWKLHHRAASSAPAPASLAADQEQEEEEDDEEDEDAPPPGGPQE
ncbi:MAG TPA: twin-arginine translocase TatA/TatE family subunit [Myxococcota bacterium]|nr:twin-arginine translocase TatA/TatE family subunit [Myxococcota bacterium]HRY93459.1 twin-arginine translocase TatA/TatE family subunit [Myxococcota bacterium]HSA20306.1 twin-arginine translocase TatA/TatE family subunit [Myxococcota bacterium]